MVQENTFNLGSDVFGDSNVNSIGTTNITNKDIK